MGDWFPIFANGKMHYKSKVAKQVAKKYGLMALFYIENYKKVVNKLKQQQKLHKTLNQIGISVSRFGFLEWEVRNNIFRPNTIRDLKTIVEEGSKLC